MIRLAALLLLCSVAGSAEESGRAILERVAAAYRNVSGFRMMVMVRVTGSGMARGSTIAFAAPDRWNVPPDAGFPDYRLVLDGLASARLVRHEEVFVAEAPVKCPVVEALYASGLKRTLWIEPRKFYVLREVNLVQGSEQTLTVSNMEWDRVPPPNAFTARLTEAGREAATGRTPPRPLNRDGYGNCQKPTVTPEAAIAQLRGMIALKFTVSTDGTPTDIEVTRPVGLGMDESAKACVSMARYQPAQQDGVPVPGHVSVAMSVGPDSQSDWHLARAEFFPEPGAERPHFRKASYPDRTGEKQSAVVQVRATIGPDGVPREVVGSGGGNPKIDQRAARIVEKWRFEGTGKEVPARFELEMGARVFHGVQ
jgi:TonB family protein